MEEGETGGMPEGKARDREGKSREGRRRVSWKGRWRKKRNRGRRPMSLSFQVKHAFRFICVKAYNGNIMVKCCECEHVCVMRLHLGCHASVCADFAQLF